MTSLYRKRLIPNECIYLKNDVIVYQNDYEIITTWQTLRPKNEFASGISYYIIEKGWKISKFFAHDGSLLYIYCDIIDTHYDTDNDSYIFTDLLADVIIENDGFVRVVDLDELADACSEHIINNDMLVTALHRLNELLTIIYNDTFNIYLETIKKYEQKR